MWQSPPPRAASSAAPRASQRLLLRAPAPCRPESVYVPGWLQSCSPFYLCTSWAREGRKTAVKTTPQNGSYQDVCARAREGAAAARPWGARRRGPERPGRPGAALGGQPSARAGPAAWRVFRGSMAFRGSIFVWNVVGNWQITLSVSLFLHF